MIRIRALVLVAGAIAIAAPAPLHANREHQQIMADIRMLQEQTQQLHLLLGALAESMRTLTARLDEQAGASRKAFADHKLLVDNVAEGVRILREKIDDTNVRISSLSQEFEALRMAAPLTAAPGGLPPEEGTEPADPAAASAPPPALPPGMTPSRLYESAYGDYAAGQWSLAIAGFEMYITSFPRTPQAAEAQFYIGQAYYADGRFQEAVNAFDRLIADYPDAPVVPEGYYKLGVALERLGQVDRARQSFETVLQRYPDSNTALLARQALERINRPVRD